jgi:hypothetical protein
MHDADEKKTKKTPGKADGYTDTAVNGNKNSDSLTSLT